MLAIGCSRATYVAVCSIDISSCQTVETIWTNAHRTVGASNCRFQCFWNQSNHIWTARIAEGMRNENLECLGCWSSSWHNHVLCERKNDNRLVSIVCFGCMQLIGKSTSKRMERIRRQFNAVFEVQIMNLGKFRILISFDFNGWRSKTRIN